MNADSGTFHEFASDNLQITLHNISINRLGLTQFKEKSYLNSLYISRIDKALFTISSNNSHIIIVIVIMPRFHDANLRFTSSNVKDVNALERLVIVLRLERRKP